MLVEDVTFGLYHLMNLHQVTFMTSCDEEAAVEDDDNEIELN